MGTSPSSLPRDEISFSALTSSYHDSSREYTSKLRALHGKQVEVKEFISLVTAAIPPIVSETFSKTIKSLPGAEKVVLDTVLVDIHFNSTGACITSQIAPTAIALPSINCTYTVKSMELKVDFVSQKTGKPGSVVKMLCKGSLQPKNTASSLADIVSMNEDLRMQLNSPLVSQGKAVDRLLRSISVTDASIPSPEIVKKLIFKYAKPNGVYATELAKLFDTHVQSSHEQLITAYSVEYLSMMLLWYSHDDWRPETIRFTFPAGNKLLFQVPKKKGIPISSEHYETKGSTEATRFFIESIEMDYLLSTFQIKGYSEFTKEVVFTYYQSSSGAHLEFKNNNRFIMNKEQMLAPSYFPNLRGCNSIRYNMPGYIIKSERFKSSEFCMPFTMCYYISRTSSNPKYEYLMALQLQERSILLDCNNKSALRKIFDKLRTVKQIGSCKMPADSSSCYACDLAWNGSTLVRDFIEHDMQVPVHQHIRELNCMNNSIGNLMALLDIKTFNLWIVFPRSNALQGDVYMAVALNEGTVLLTVRTEQGETIVIHKGGAYFTMQKLYDTLWKKQLSDIAVLTTTRA